MKKLFFLLMLAGCYVTAFADSPDGGRTTADIQVDEARLPIKPMRPRFEAPTHTEGELNFGNQTVDVKMNSYMGELNVAITDESGIPVYETTADSDATAKVSMPMPDAGSYRLVITGEEYLAEGEFTVE